MRTEQQNEAGNVSPGKHGDYRTHRDAPKLAALHLQSYIDAQVRAGELLRWHISVRGLTREDPVLGTEDLHLVGAGPVNAMGRSREKDSQSSIKALINPATLGADPRGDQIVGLTPDQLTRAHRMTVEDGLRTSEALEQVRPREEGLLLLYPISRNSKAGSPRRGEQKRVDLFDDPDRDGATVIGLAVALPHSDSPATRRYVVGSAGPVTG